MMRTLRTPTTTSLTGPRALQSKVVTGFVALCASAVFPFILPNISSASSPSSPASPPTSIDKIVILEEEIPELEVTSSGLKGIVDNIEVDLTRLEELASVADDVNDTINKRIDAIQEELEVLHDIIDNTL